MIPTLQMGLRAQSEKEHSFRVRQLGIWLPHFWARGIHPTSPSFLDPTVGVTGVAGEGTGQRPDTQRCANPLGEGRLEKSAGSQAWQCPSEALWWVD